jgi:hypothetical protein
MPRYGDVHMNQFINLAKSANSGFRESTSSLNALCKLLRKDSRADQIANAIAAIPQAKQQVYGRAITHLRTTFPGLGLTAQGVGGGQVAQQALDAFQAREARVQSRYMTRNITQRQGTTDYSWDVKLTFEDRPTTLVVKPVIRYRPKPSDPHAHNPTEKELSTWKARIQGAWKAKFSVDGKAKDVVFDINFVDWNAPVGNGAYEIDVVNITVQDAQKQILVQQGVMAQGATLQSQNWKVREMAKKLTLDGSSLGTPHLMQWGVQDMQAVVHEFGHAIGCPDEYLVTAHNVNYGGHAAAYNFAPFSTDSLMNDTVKAKIYKRHFAVVAALYAEWKTPQGGQPPAVAVVEPKD